MRAFLRVVDSGSFTAAAEQMQLTTAQVSRLISELETRLHAKLLQRTTRQRALTDVGVAYAERCREVIEMIDEAEAQATGTATQVSGRLRLQCMANFGQHYVAPVMADFCASHPLLTVEYRTSQYVPDILARGVDVSLYLAESLADSGMVARKLGTTFSVLCASPAYLTRHGEPQRPSELEKHRCLRLINPSIAPDWRLTSTDSEFQRPSVAGGLVADTPELLLSVALRDAGIALLPLFSVIDAIRAGELKRVLPGWRSPEISVYALLPSRRFLEAKTRAWLQWAEVQIVPKIKADVGYFMP